MDVSELPIRSFRAAIHNQPAPLTQLRAYGGQLVKPATVAGVECLKELLPMMRYDSSEQVQPFSNPTIPANGADYKAVVYLVHKQMPLRL